MDSRPSSVTPLERTQAALAALYLVAALAWLIWMAWVVTPPAQKAAISRGLRLSLLRLVRKTARRTGAASVSREALTGGRDRNYSLPYWLSQWADRIEQDLQP